MINFLFCTVLLPGAAKVDQTHKYYDFLNLMVIFNDTIQCFYQNKSFRNYVINNFEFHNQLSRIDSFHSKSV